MGNRIVHFEIPAGNVERLSKFYTDLFGWKFSKQSMPGMDYWLIETSGSGLEHLGGGMYLKQGETDKPRFYMHVDDIDAHTAKLKQAGGTVIYEKQEIPGMGWSVLAVDPENNLIGLFQPSRAPPAPAKKKAKPAKKKSKGRRK
ncbi:MAG: VOC family protein [Thaumarchaeota archaeon]|nr:VOC family protein [Nitrososphaerota archaeon]